MKVNYLSIIIIVLLIVIVVELDIIGHSLLVSNERLKRTEALSTELILNKIESLERNISFVISNPHPDSAAYRGFQEFEELIKQRENVQIKLYNYDIKLKSPVFGVDLKTYYNNN